MKPASTDGVTGSILICEDEVLLAKDLARSVKQLGYNVAGMVTKGEDAVQFCKNMTPNLVLMDIRLDGALDGVEAAQLIRENQDIPIIYVSAYSESNLMERVKRSHPYGYLTKPATTPELRNAIDLALYKHHADRRVRKSEERYRAIVDNYPWGALFIFDRDLRYTHCGGEALAEAGLHPRDMVGKTISEIFPESVSRIAEAHCRAVFEGVSSEYEVRYKNRDYHNHAAPIIRDDGSIEEGAVFTRDITDSKRAQQELALANETLLRSEKQKTDILNAIGEMVAYQDREGNVIWANRVSGESVGQAPESLAGRRCYEIWHNRSSRCPDCPPAGAFETGESSEGEIQSPDGRYWRLKGYPVKDSDGSINGIVEVGREITEEKRARDIIQASLKEKETLLREVHHRVKNNLAVINSLLNLQADLTTDQYHMDMFRECQDRIRSMAMAHELLYSSENIGDIKASEYMDSLIESLKNSYGLLGSNIRVEKALEEIPLSLDEAIPIGFIVTELISNSFKHAFNDRDGGEVSVSFRALEDNGLELSVRDNGRGFPSDADPKNMRSLGLELVETFTDQLGGVFELKRDNGLEARVLFTRNVTGPRA